MTVSSTEITSGPYLGNGIADTFSYSFRVNDKTEVSVYETDDSGIETLLTVDTHYTVNGVGLDAGGTITRVTGALPTDYMWFIRSNFDETQLTAFASQGAFFPDVHEEAMDKLTRISQQLLDKLGRSPRVSDSYTGVTPLTLDNPAAGFVLRWKSDLSGVENFDTEAAYVNVTGDTMASPLAGPDAVGAGDYMPQNQVAEVIDARMQSAPDFDPNNFQDYGLVTQSVGDSNDYGSL